MTLMAVMVVEMDKIEKCIFHPAFVWDFHDKDDKDEDDDDGKYGRDQSGLVWRHQYELHIYCDEDDGDDYDGEDNNGMMM